MFNAVSELSFVRESTQECLWHHLTSLCVCVCLRACASERDRERALIPTNLSAMSDEYFPQRSIGRTGPIEMPPRSPDSTQRLLSSLRCSRTERTVGNRGMLAKLKGKPETSGTQRLVRGSASGFLQNAGKYVLDCRTYNCKLSQFYVRKFADNRIMWTETVEGWTHAHLMFL